MTRPPSSRGKAARARPTSLPEQRPRKLLPSTSSVDESYAISDKSSDETSIDLWSTECIMEEEGGQSILQEEIVESDESILYFEGNSSCRFGSLQPTPIFPAQGICSSFNDGDEKIPFFSIPDDIHDAIITTFRK